MLEKQTDVGAKPLFRIEDSRCKICYACVRVCPVSAIQVSVQEEYPRILTDRCIGCGLCMLACEPDAIFYRDSIEDTRSLLKAKGKVAAIVAPSISGEFDDITDYRKFVGMIRALGFDYVNEVSFGVDLVAKEYSKLFSEFKGRYYFTANCPAVVSYVEKFRPEMLDNLAPVVSPMIATAMVVRESFGEDVKVVYIGPCIESKDEALKYKGKASIDAVITFRELRQLFDQEGILERSLEFSDFDPPIGYKGSLYPLSEGLLEAADIHDELKNEKVVTVEGKDDVLQAGAEFASSIEQIGRHFNCFFCNGCLMGPGTSYGGDKYLRRSLVTDYSKRRLKNFDVKSWEKEMDRFSHLSLATSFEEDVQRIPFPKEEKIQDILRMIGKEDESEHAGCFSCGYPTCRDFAVAVAKGLAKTDMCLTYSLKTKQDYIQTLRVTNEKLAKTQEALKDSEKKAREEEQLAREASETINAMLQKIPSGLVIVDKSLKILQSNQQFISMLGEEAADVAEVVPGLIGADLKTLLPYNFYNLFTFVLDKGETIEGRDVKYGRDLFNVSLFTIKKGRVVGAVIRDMYVPEVRKEEVIKRVTEVITQNLEMVQQIGFLLGEGASNTEKMLNSIIESHKSQKSGNENG